MPSPSSLPFYRAWSTQRRAMTDLGTIDDILTEQHQGFWLQKDRVLMEGLGVTDNTGRDIYEGDIIEFTIDGTPHGPEADHCRAAHVWWCVEDGCWAFGRWDWTHNGKHRGWWWYTLSDSRFNKGSLNVLGNVWENPELLPLLGYTPEL